MSSFLPWLRHPRDWRSYFSWNLIQCDVNGHAVWCAVQKCLALRKSLELLIVDESVLPPLCNIIQLLILFCFENVETVALMVNEILG